MMNRSPLRVVSLLSLLTGLCVAACSNSPSGSESSNNGGTSTTNASGAGGHQSSSNASKGGSKQTTDEDTGSGGSERATTAENTGTGGKSSSSGSAMGGKSSSSGSATGGKSSTDGNPTGGKSSTDGNPTGGKSSTKAAAGSGNVSNGGAAPVPPSDENTGADCDVTAGAQKKNQKLPDPFAMHDGTRISAKSDWACRRNEIKKDIEKYEIGPKPEPPKVEATFSDGTLNVKVTTDAGSITLSSKVSGSGSCVAIGMNGASGLISGCTQVPFSHDQVVKYNMNDTRVQSDPFYKVYPDLWNKVSNYSAWSWGISRLIDGIEQVKDQMKVDPTKIGVHGCSYAGKMALFGGAFDERVALTIAQESGGGGINAWRTSQDFTARTGTNIEKIDNTNYSWFLPSMKSLDPYSLPHDHHELIAMVAPRPLLALGNPDMEWLGDESGYKSVMAAVEVWKALGVPGNIGYDFASGHDHCKATSSQTSAATAFVNKFLKGQSGDTAIAAKPNNSKFSLAYENDWTAPTLQ